MNIALDLIQAFLVFLLLSLSAWGIGHALLYFILKDRRVFSPSVETLLSLSIGFGVIGETTFLMGMAGNLYQTKYFLILFIFFSFYAARRLQKHFPKIHLRKFISEASVLEKIVWAVVVFDLALWLWSAVGFRDDSDAISHHFQHPKVCMQFKHFGYGVQLPYGLDVMSNYTPVLMHMVYLVCKLLADDRSIHFVHWLHNLMLILFLYLIVRDFISRPAAITGLAVFLGFSSLDSLPFYVTDYIMQAVFMLASLYVLLAYSRAPDFRYLVLAALLAGFMLCVKLYGVVLLPALCLFLFGAMAGTPAKKVKVCALFGLMAGVLCVPWFLFLTRTFGNPFYPWYFSRSDYDIYFLYRPVFNFGTLLTPADKGYFWPNVLYRLALFIPFAPQYRSNGLSPLFLIGIPVSIFFLVFRRKEEKWKMAGLFFLMSLLIHAGIDLATSFTAFYKWCIFSGLVYVISLSALWDKWDKETQRQATAVILCVAAMNTAVLADTIVRTPLPHLRQEEIWTPLARYLNATMKKGARVTGHDEFTDYYLRDDMVTLLAPYSYWALDWQVEERLIRKMRMEYYIFHTGYQKKMLSIYSRQLHLLKLVGDEKRFSLMCHYRQLYLRRAEHEKQFLKKYGRLVDKVPDDIELYKLNL